MILLYLIAEEDEDGLLREVCIALDWPQEERIWLRNSRNGVLWTWEEMRELRIIQVAMDQDLPHR